jgi:hypothetical protein
VVPGPVCVSRSFCSFRNIDFHPCMVRLDGAGLDPVADRRSAIWNPVPIASG